MNGGIIKAGLVASTFGLVATEGVDPVTMGGIIGKMSVTGVLATLAVVCILAVMRQHQEQRTDREAMLKEQRTDRETMLKEQRTDRETITLLIQENIRTNQHVASLLADIKESLRK